MEVYPLLSKEEFVLSVKQDPQFKDGWQQVCGGAVAAEKKAFLKLHFVEGNSWTGFEMSRKMAFVHELEYNAKVGCVLGGPECTAERIMLPGYSRNAASVPGTLMEFEDLPPNVKFEKVWVFSGTDRRLRSQHLNPQNTFRPGQPRDRFRYAADKFKIPFSGAPGTGKSFKALKDEAEKVQAELELKNEAEMRNAGAALRGVISHPASTLANEDEDAAIEGVGTPGARRGRGGGGGARRGGPGPGVRAAPGTPRPVSLSVPSVVATFAAPGTPGLGGKKPRRSQVAAAQSLVQQVVHGVKPAAGTLPANQDLLGDSVSVAGGSGGTQVGVSFGAAIAVSVDLQERSFDSLIQQILLGSQLGRELRKASLQ